MNKINILKYELGGRKDQDNIICDLCRHSMIRHYTCLAFPDGIPEEILKGENRHSKPLAEQENDIIFELKQKVIPYF
jgi:hypothetical protein